MLGLPVVVQAIHGYVTFSSPNVFFLIFKCFIKFTVQEPFATSFLAEAKFSACKIEQKVIFVQNQSKC